MDGLHNYVTDLQGADGLQDTAAKACREGEGKAWTHGAL
jgi:hypothetical protein